nr:unnamed protein product [Callosobruchus analis]
MDDTVQKLLAKAKDLPGFLKTCTNTKSEIKRAGGQIMQLCLRLNRLNLDRSTVPQASPSADSGVQVQPLTKDMQVQTELQAHDVGYTAVDSATQTLGEEEKETERQRAYIRAAISKHSSFDGFLQVADMEWPRSAFERVHEDVGDVMSASWDHDLVSFVTSDFNIGKGVLKRFKERYQGIEELKA